MARRQLPLTPARIAHAARQEMPLRRESAGVVSTEMIAEASGEVLHGLDEYRFLAADTPRGILLDAAAAHEGPRTCNCPVEGDDCHDLDAIANAEHSPALIWLQHHLVRIAGHAEKFREDLSLTPGGRELGCASAAPPGTDIVPSGPSAAPLPDSAVRSGSVGEAVSGRAWSPVTSRGDGHWCAAGAQARLRGEDPVTPHAITLRSRGRGRTGRPRYV